MVTLRRMVQIAIVRVIVRIAVRVRMVVVLAAMQVQSFVPGAIILTHWEQFHEVLLS